MLTDWYYCAATRMTGDATAALLAALDVLDHPSVDDDVIVLALDRLLRDPSGALFGYGRTLAASCRRRGVPEVAQAQDRVDSLVTAEAPVSVAKFLAAVRRGHRADRIASLAAAAATEVLQTPGDPATGWRTPYADLEVHAASLLVLDGSRQAVSEDPGVAERLVDDDTFTRLVASAAGGGRGRAALLAANRLRHELGENGRTVANEAWRQAGDAAGFQPDLLGLVAELRHDPDQVGFEDLRSEWLSWPWLSGNLVPNPNQAEARAAGAVIGCPAPSVGLAVLLWQAALSVHAACTWPEQFAELVAPSPTTGGHRTGPWSAANYRLPDGGTARVDLRERTAQARPAWAAAVAHLVMFRGRTNPTVRHSSDKKAPFVLSDLWAAQAFSPWIDRESDRIDWNPNAGMAYGDVSTPHLLRFAGSGFAVIELLRREVASDGILELFLHLADVLGDRSTQPGYGKATPATEGPMAGLLERLRSAVKVFGQAYEPALPPARLVEVVEAKPRGGPTALRAITGKRGRQLLAMWATESLGGSIAGQPAPWEEGTPPLAQRVLYDVATTGSLAGMIQRRAAGSLHVYYPGVLFERSSWRTFGDQPRGQAGKIGGWPTTFDLLATDRLAPEDWVPPWPEPNSGSVLLVRSIERFSSLLFAGHVDEARLEAWVADLVHRCRMVSSAMDLPRVVRRRMLTTIGEAHARGWVEPEIAEAVDELIRSVIVFGRGNPGDISKLLVQVANAASVPDRERELLRLRVAVLQASALMPPDEREASDLRFAAGRAAVALDLDRRRAAMLLAAGTALDPTTQRPVPDRALSWWRSAELEGRRHASERMAADLLAGRDAALTAVRAVALDALGRPTALIDGATPVGARRNATVSERFHDGRRTLHIEIEGHSRPMDLDGVHPRVLDQWDPDLSRSFRAPASDQPWVIVVEHDERNGWVPIDGGPVELVAALADPGSEQVLTLAGRIGSDRFRLVRRPGESFLVEAASITDAEVRRQLVSAAAGLRVRIAPEPDGEHVRLVPQPVDESDVLVDDRNLQWRAQPDDAVDLVQRADGAWVWPRNLAPVFPDPEVDIRPTTSHPRADLSWGPRDLRRARTTGTEVQEVRIEAAEPPDLERFKRLFDVREGDVVELAVISVQSDASLSHGRTVDNQGVNVVTESVSLRADAPPAALTRGRRAVVTQARRGDEEVLIAELAGDTSWLPDRIEGVVADAPAGSVLAWFDLGTALQRDIHALVLHPDNQKRRVRVGDRVRIDSRGAARRVMHIPRIVRVEALWRTRTVDQLPNDPGVFLGEVVRHGVPRAVWEVDGRAEFLLTPVPTRPIQHLDRLGGKGTAFIGTAPVDALKAPGRWRVELGGTSLIGDGPRTGEHGIVTDVAVSLRDRGPQSEVVPSRRFSVAAHRSAAIAGDRVQQAWDAYLSDPKPLTGIRKGGSVRLDDLQVRGPDGAWTREVPLGPEETSPLVSGVRYPATWRVVVEGTPPLASHRRVADRTLGELIGDEGLSDGRSQRLGQPLYFVEQAPDGSLQFERGFGDRIRVPAAQVSIDDQLVDPLQGVPMFLGDRLDQVSIEGTGDEAVLHIAANQVRYSLARRLVAEASGRVVHLLHLRSTRATWKVEAVEGLDLRSNLGEAQPPLTQEERRVRAEVTGLAEPTDAGQERSVLGRLDVGRFERTGGHEVVFAVVAPEFSERGLRHNDVAIVVAGAIEERGGDWRLHCSFPLEGGETGQAVSITRRSFSARESLLPFLGAESRTALAGRRIPVKLMRRDRHGLIEGTLRSLPRRNVSALRDKLRLGHRNDLFAVVSDADRHSIVLELDVAVTVRLERRDVSGPKVSEHTVVRVTVGADDRFHLEPVSSGDREFAVANRPVIAFALARAVNKATAARPRDHDFTIGGLADELYRASDQATQVALVTGRHPRLAYISRIGERTLELGTGEAAAVKIRPADDGTVTVKPVGGKAQPATWMQLSVAEQSATGLARWATGARWRYHESRWGHRPDDADRSWHQLGWRNLANEPVLLPAPTRARLRPDELRRFAFPARELLDRAERNQAFTAHVAAVVLDGDKAPAPPGLYIETAPGRIVHLPAGLLRTSSDEGDRSLRALDLRLLHQGDRLRLRIRAARPTDQPYVELLSWHGSPTAAWHGKRAVLPVAPADATRTTQAGAGHFSMLVPTELEGALAAFGRNGAVDVVAETDILVGDVVLIEARGDGLGVCGTSLGAQADEAEERPVLRALASPKARAQLLAAVGGALPVTVANIKDGVVTFGLSAQRFRRPNDDAIGIATVLGPVGDRVLLGFGSSLVLADPHHLLPTVPKECRWAALEVLRARRQPVFVHVDRGWPTSGIGPPRSGRLDVRIVDHAESSQRAGFVALDDDGAVRWIDHDELCWARVGPDRTAGLVKGLSARRVAAWFGGDCGTALIGSRLEDQWDSLRPGVSRRVVPLKSTMQGDAGGWSLLGLLYGQVVVELSGVGPLPAIGEPVIVEVRTTVREPRRVVHLVEPGRRPAIWDVPSGVRSWLQNRGTPQAGPLASVAPDAALRRALAPDVDRRSALAALATWLEATGPQLVGVGDGAVELEGISALIALRMLRAEIAGDVPAETSLDGGSHPIADLLALATRAVAWRAARSIHLEALVASWNPRAGDPYWERLSAILPKGEPVVAKDASSAAGRLAALRYRVLDGELDQELDTCLAALAYAAGELDAVQDIDTLEQRAPACSILVELLRSLPSACAGEVALPDDAGRLVEAALDIWLEQPDRPWRLIPLEVDPPLWIQTRADQVLVRAISELRRCSDTDQTAVGADD